MNFNQYVPNKKGWDHVGNLTPNVEHSEAHRPHGNYMPADWLPVGRYEKYYEDWFTVSSGKILAFDREERVVPAGLKVAFAVGSGDVLTYTVNDYNQHVTDLTTGARVVIAGAGYTRAEITAALISRGLIESAEFAEDFISHPVGVAPYNFYKWAGGDGFNPSGYHFNNYNMQHRVSILCKYVMELPHVPSVHAAILANALSVVDTMTSWITAEWVTATGLAKLVRYPGLGAKVIGLNLNVTALAKSTAITPISFALLMATFFVTEKASADLLTSAGDYFIDYDVGMILVNDGATGVATGAVPTAAGDTITFFHYEAAPGTVSTYACILGDVQCGDFLVADANSNYVKPAAFAAADVTVSSTGDPTDAEIATVMNQITERQDAIIGQVLDSDVHPKDYLDRVRTAYTGLATGVLDQMPGSASAGFIDAITYSSASDRMVRVLLLK